jgi:hypothetical protein
MSSASTPLGLFKAIRQHDRASLLTKARLAVLILALASPALRSQTIVLDGWQREIQARLTAQNDLGQSYDSGYVYTNLMDVTPGSYQQTNAFTVSGVALAGGNLGVGHDTSVDVSPTSLVVTGAVSVSKYVMQMNDGTHFGGAGALGQCYASFLFRLNQPCNFTLVASTVHSPYKSPGTGGNACESIVEFFGGVQNGFTIDTGFGQTYPQAVTPKTFPDSGTTTGVLQPGGYTLVVDAQDSSTLDPSFNSDSYTANRSVSFSLTVTVLPQAPTDLALTPAGTNTYQLTWTAPIDGTYRVLSSTNLVDWREYVSPTNLPAGPVTNQIVPLQGSSQSFFRVEALQ